MKIDSAEIQRIALGALKDYLVSAGADLKAGVEEDLAAIAADAASYATRAAAGDPTAVRDEEHLRAQAQLLAARLELKEARRLVNTLEAVAVAVAGVLARVAVAAL